MPAHKKFVWCAVLYRFARNVQREMCRIVANPARICASFHLYWYYWHFFFGITHLKRLCKVRCVIYLRAILNIRQVSHAFSCLEH